MMMLIKAVYFLTASRIIIVSFLLTNVHNATANSGQIFAKTLNTTPMDAPFRTQLVRSYVECATICMRDPMCHTYTLPSKMSVAQACNLYKCPEASNLTIQDGMDAYVKGRAWSKL